MKTGLLGYPIAHSLSPTIHNAAYAALGLDWHYALYPCKDAPAFTRMIREAQAQPEAFVGFNVTTPHKSIAYQTCTEHSPFAAATGSANVLTFLADASAPVSSDVSVGTRPPRRHPPAQPAPR
ncbi:MAG: hypothetical protein LBH56_03400, partial [Coriobacteriales bacterium]|nr:hypothetical protein [Coriobacteriales bacterium]